KGASGISQAVCSGQTAAPAQQQLQSTSHLVRRVAWQAKSRMTRRPGRNDRGRGPTIRLWRESSGRVLIRRRDRGEGSRGAGELGADGDGEVGLMEPAAGVGGALPALQRDGADVVALLVVEQVEVGVGEAAADLGGGPADVEEAFGSVVEDGDGAPALRFRFRVIEHRLTLLGRWMTRSGIR